MSVSDITVLSVCGQVDSDRPDFVHYHKIHSLQSSPRYQVPSVYDNIQILETRYILCHNNIIIWRPRYLKFLHDIING